MTGFDPSQPSSNTGSLPQALLATNSNLNNLNTRLAGVEGANPVAIAAEVATARGNAPSLAARLNQSLDASGNLIFASLTSLMWIQSPDAISYVSANSFTVAGNCSNTYVPGLVMKFALGSAVVYSPVASVSYSSGSGLTTVILTYAVLTNALSAGYWGLGVGPQGAPGLNVANAGGTANAITASSPGVSTADKVVVCVIATAGNTITNPTFQLNADAAHTIVTRGSGTLRIGDIPGQYYAAFLEYNAALAAWVLLNPDPHNYGCDLWGGVASGTANALVLTTGLSVSGVKKGQVIGWRTGSTASTGALTLAIDGMAATTLQVNGAAAAGGALQPNTNYSAIYDGAVWQTLGGGLSLGQVWAAILSA